MQPIINQLVQLQELIVALAQQKAGSPGAQLRELEESIHALKSGIPEAIDRQFSRLIQKDPLAIVPVMKGVCAACGMALPISLTHEVHAAEKIYTCPSCARMLYYSEGGPRNTRKPPRRSDPPRVGIERFSAESLMIPSLAGTDRDSILREMSRKLADEGFVDNAPELAEGSIRREAIISTTVDHGLAFPHVRCVEGGALTMALGIAQKPVKFDPAGKAVTRIIFFMVIPTAASAFYLKLLSGLSQTFLKEENREKLLTAETPEKLWKALVKTTRQIIQ